MTRSAWVASAKRSPVAPTGGILAGFEVFEVATPVMKACLDEVDCPSDLVDEVILGNALYAGGNPARMAVLAAGLPDTVAGLTIDRQCAGGLDAVALAKFLVESGAADVVLAGGAQKATREDPNAGRDCPEEEIRSHTSDRLSPHSPIATPTSMQLRTDWRGNWEYPAIARISGRLTATERP